MMDGFVCGPRWLPEGIPDLSSDADPCCAGRALDGPRACTCWIEVFSEPQADPRPGPPPVPDPLRPCEPGERDGGCAYRAGSPEKRGEPGYGADAADLDQIAASGQPFFCHAGMRYLIGYVHPPTGTAWSPAQGDFRPPIVGGVPYRANGEPGFVCAGWLLRRYALTRRVAR
jgi:hypothetical protein